MKKKELFSLHRINKKWREVQFSYNKKSGEVPILYLGGRRFFSTKEKTTQTVAKESSGAKSQCSKPQGVKTNLVKNTVPGTQYKTSFVRNTNSAARKRGPKERSRCFPKASVADTDPSDPYVLGPPGSGSGSASQRYGSGFFYHQAKIVRQILIPTLLWLLFDFLSLKNDVNVPSKSNKQKNFFKLVFVGVLKVNNENSWIRIRRSGSGSISQMHGSAYPDPYQNVMDPHHCPKHYLMDQDLDHCQRHGSAYSDQDPYQNAMDPQHCPKHYLTERWRPEERPLDPAWLAGPPDCGGRWWGSWAAWALCSLSGRGRGAQRVGQAPGSASPGSLWCPCRSRRTRDSIKKATNRVFENVNAPIQEWLLKEYR